MKEIICPVCNNHSGFRFRKEATDYFQCSSCKIIFSIYIDQEGLVGGGAHEERNTKQNPQRIDRVNKLTVGNRKDEVFILDFGCGFGRLVNDLRAAGYTNTFGYDSYNEMFSKLPDANRFHLIISVECIEHLGAPFIEMDAMYRWLKPGGIVMLESGFLNAAWEDGLSDKDNPYINPIAGHCTIHTHHSIDLLMNMKGFSPREHINRHCRIYQKSFNKK